MVDLARFTNLFLLNSLEKRTTLSIPEKEAQYCINYVYLAIIVVHQLRLLGPEQKLLSRVISRYLLLLIETILRGPTMPKARVTPFSCICCPFCVVISHVKYST